MTLVELIVVLYLLAASALGVAVGARHGLLGALVGLVLAWGVSVGAMLLLAVVGDWFLLLSAPPACPTLRCGRRAYDRVGRHPQGDLHRCRCGDLFVLSPGSLRRRARFYAVGARGELLLLHERRFGRWR